MIRPATAADRDAIGALHLASWRSTYGIELSEEVLRDVLPGYLGAKWAGRTFGAGEVTLVAEADDALAGFACALTDREVPLIDNLHVRPDLRGAGTGARLLAAVNGALAEAGFARSTLTVLERNARAHAFYLAQGGTDEGGEDDVLVGKPVRVRLIGFDLG